RVRLHPLSLLPLLLSTLPPPPATSPLSLHDALPISRGARARARRAAPPPATAAARAIDRRRSVSATPPPSPPRAIPPPARPIRQDRKSTRLNSSHVSISYAVFCLKKKKNNERPRSKA